MTVQIVNLKKKRSNSGFSLIEVSIILTIIGLLMVPLIQLYNIEQKDYVFNKTQDSMAYVSNSLTKYFIETGRYPRPAVRNLSEGSAGSANFGAEVAAGAIGACVGNDVTPCIAGDAIIGDIPFKTMGINVEHIVDGYGGKLTYAVTENMTGVGPYADDVGELDVDLGVTFVREDGSIEDKEVNDAHFVLISHGKDGAGAFSIGGALKFACPIGNQDAINCNNANSAFTTNYKKLGPDIFNRAQYLVTGSDHYDDYISYVTSAQGYIWTYSVAQLDMENRNPGNALIGTIPPSLVVRLPYAVAKLEVMGNVDTDRLSTPRLCSTDIDPEVTNELITCPDPFDPTNPLTGTDPYKEGVFDPAIIAVGTTDPSNYEVAGRGIHCGLTAMSGIANSDEICANFAPPSFGVGLVPCSGGEIPTGIDSVGQFICELP